MGHFHSEVTHGRLDIQRIRLHISVAAQCTKDSSKKNGRESPGRGGVEVRYRMSAVRVCICETYTYV